MSTWENIVLIFSHIACCFRYNFLLSPITMLFSVFMWHRCIPTTFSSEVLAASDKRSCRNLMFDNVLAWRGSSFCYRTFSFPSFFVVWHEMAARKGCCAGQKMSYCFIFCKLNGPCSWRSEVSLISIVFFISASCEQSEIPLVEKRERQENCQAIMSNEEGLNPNGVGNLPHNRKQGVHILESEEEFSVCITDVFANFQSILVKF